MAWALPGKAGRSPTVLLAELPPGQLCDPARIGRRDFPQTRLSGPAASICGHVPSRREVPACYYERRGPRPPPADEDYYVDALTFCSTTTAVGTRPSASSVAPSSR